MATVVALPAHPDDEVLHMGGTLARMAAEGHRVVIVTATDGSMKVNPADGEPPRLAQLRASGAELGAARVESLGYADSGHGKDLYADPPDRQRFVRVDTEVAAKRFAKILREENADMLLIHDANGGYGHRDHVKAHEVGKRAGQLASVPRILAATVPREFITRLAPAFGYKATDLYLPRREITHSINVRPFAKQKRAALVAHHNQFSGSRSSRMFQKLLGLPDPVFGLLLGREWFAEVRMGQTVQR